MPLREGTLLSGWSLSYFFSREFLGSRFMLWSLFWINFLGTVYGYEWYWGQLTYTAVEMSPLLLPFVPDSPTASLFFTGVLLYLLRDRNSRVCGSVRGGDFFQIRDLGGFDDYGLGLSRRHARMAGLDADRLAFGHGCRSAALLRFLPVPVAIRRCCRVLGIVERFYGLCGWRLSMAS
jgi:hypothetical protein